METEIEKKATFQSFTILVHEPFYMIFFPTVQQISTAGGEPWSDWCDKSTFLYCPLQLSLQVGIL